MREQGEYGEEGEDSKSIIQGVSSEFKQLEEIINSQLLCFL